jgi:hypothetical protein
MIEKILGDPVSSAMWACEAILYYLERCFISAHEVALS